MMISLPAPEPRQSDTPGAADPHHAMLVSGELELVWSQHHGYINVFIRTPVLCWTPTQAWVGYVVSLIISQTSILYLYCPARSSDTQPIAITYKYSNGEVEKSLHYTTFCLGFTIIYSESEIFFLLQKKIFIFKTNLVIFSSGKKG